MKITAFYCRVSTVDRNPELQIGALQEYRRDHKPPFENVRWFEDAGEADQNSDRPGWRELLHRIDQGQVRTLVVWRLDRPFSTLIETVDLMTRLIEHNVHYISLTESFDLKTADGLLAYKALCDFAVFELDLKIERFQAKRKVARTDIYRCKACKKSFKYDCKLSADGNNDICPLCGAATMVFYKRGKRWGGSKRGVLRKLTPYKIKRVKELRSQGLSLRQISGRVSVHFTTAALIVRGHYDR